MQPCRGKGFSIVMIIGYMETMHVNKNILYFSCFCIGAIWLSSSSWAQSVSENGAMDDLKNCQLIQKDKPRLECYDQAMSKLNSAIQSKDLFVIEKSEIEEAREENFGKSSSESAPIRAIIDKEASNSKDESHPDLVSVIVKTEKTTRNRTRFYLENGQIWEQTNSGNVYVSKKKTNTAHIRKASITGYKLKINNKGTLIRVKRIK